LIIIMNLIHSIFFSNTKIIFKALFLAGPDERVSGLRTREEWTSWECNEEIITPKIKQSKYNE